MLENFPLCCPKCKQETLINIKQLIFQLSKSHMHRRRADNL
ncbi:cysteine-rich KTR domain-containing protein [Clostridioides difficile]